MESDPADPLPTALAGLAALAVAMGIGRFAFTPLLPMMQREGLVTLAGGGWLAAANYAGYFVGAVAALFLRARAATAIRAGLLAIAFSTFAMGLHEGLVAWSAWRGIAGIASAWVLVFGSAWALERLARGAPSLGGLVFSGVGAGIAFAGLASLGLMLSGLGSAFAWTFLGASALLLTALAWKAFD
jgi:hypothetical protein